MQMNKLTQITDDFRQTAEVEAETPIMAGGPVVDFLRPVMLPSTMELLALGKLVGLRRRALGRQTQELAQKVGIPVSDLLSLEEGAVAPVVLGRLADLARELVLPEMALRELAGGKLDPTGRIHQATKTFVDRTTLAVPTPGEAEAMEAFIRDLEAA
jgi:hypothetical protein